MTEASDRVAALVGGPPAEPPAEDLLAGATLRTRLALATVSAGHLRELHDAQDREPAEDRTRVRWRLTPQLAALAALLLVAGGALAAWQVWPRGSDAVLVTLDAPAGGSVSGAGTTAGPEVVVHVVGAVRRPGVVHLAVGARVTDAVEAVGGVTEDADLTALNLARLLADGEQVVVPAVPDPAAGAGAAAVNDPRVDLNAADADALDTLPGIGPVLADRIVAWRAEHGRFSDVEELAEVTGIGPALLAGLRDLVRL